MQATDGQIITIGQGNDAFDLKISIEKFQNQSNIILNHNSCWLSYRFFGQVLQSEIIGASTGFTPMVKSFRIRSSIPDLMVHFGDKKNRSLRVHVCTSGHVLGTATVDLLPLFGDVRQKQDFEGAMMDGEYVIHPAATNSSARDGSSPDTTSARLTITTSLDKEVQRDNPRPSSAKVRLSISSQTDLQDNPNHARTECGSPSPKQALHKNQDDEYSERQKHLDEKENDLKAKEMQLAKKEKQVYESTVALEKKRLEWEQWRHQEELKWHEKLRSKEAVAMRSIEERASSIEKEKMRSLESSRCEYEKLESRLRSALVGVESKERQLKEVQVSHENEQKRKMAELDLREKLMKEELKHTIEIERAKTSAAIDQSAVVEKSLAAAGKKIQLLEDEIDEIRAKHRSTPEVALMQQLAEAKGQLADSERRIEMIKAEKSEVMLEKEHFRASVNKLARALRHEKEKTTAKNNNKLRQQQVRLSYDENDNAFVLGGGEDEVQRILTDLSNLSKIQTPMKSMTTTTNNITTPPIPSPPPSRPSYCSSPVPSTNSGSNCRYDTL